MRRRLITRALLLLALGVITTITLASTLSYLASHLNADRIPARTRIVEHDGQSYRVFISWPQAWPGASALSWRYDGLSINSNPQDAGMRGLGIDLHSNLVPRWSCIQDEGTRRAAESLLPKSIRLHADWVAGFPLPALRGRLTPESLTDTQHIQIRDGMLRFRDSTPRISIGDGLWLTGHLFPLIPIWPGFLADTAIYAAAWWGLLAGFTTIRRAGRRRRNQCPHCGYDLRDTPPGNPCPECGRNPRP